MKVCLPAHVFFLDHLARLLVLSRRWIVEKEDLFLLSLHFFLHVVNIDHAIIGNHTCHPDVRVLRLRLDALILHIDWIGCRQIVALGGRSLVAEQQLLVFEPLQLLLSLLLYLLNFFLRNAKQNAHVLDLLIVHRAELELFLEAFLLPLELGDDPLLILCLVVGIVVFAVILVY